jgi:hypothetical protein
MDWCSLRKSNQKNDLLLPGRHPACCLTPIPLVAPSPSPLLFPHLFYSVIMSTGLSPCPLFSIHFSLSTPTAVSIPNAPHCPISRSPTALLLHLKSPPPPWLLHSPTLHPSPRKKPKPYSTSPRKKPKPFSTSPRRFIARTYGASSEGITLSPVQAERATQLSQTEGLGGQCQFQVRNTNNRTG